MIPFFRKIRKKMADDNRPLKYARYAIGEIVLVVIGILIALQINTWNQERQNQKEAHRILLRLEHEFETNNEMIQGIIDIHNLRRNAANILKNQFSPKSRLNIDSLKTLMLEINGDWKYEPIKNVVEGLISSGKIELIGNDSLVDDVRYWATTLNQYNELYKSQQEFFEKNVLFIFIEHYPFSEFDPMMTTEFDPDIDAIFNNAKNQNTLIVFQGKVETLLNWTNHIKEMQHGTLKKIESELNGR